MLFVKNCEKTPLAGIAPEGGGIKEYNWHSCF